MYNFVSIFSFLLAGVAADLLNLCVYASGWFSCANGQPIITIIFKENLKSLEAEIVKIFKNIQSHPKN